METIKTLTEHILFGTIKNRLDLEEKINGQWEYKKDKTFADIKIAVAKGIEMGHGKTERIECVEMCLETVFKKVKATVNK